MSDPAYGLVVQLPLEGFLKKDGGLNFVLKRPGGSKPEWVQGPHNKDFWVPFNLVGTQIGLLVQSYRICVLITLLSSLALLVIIGWDGGWAAYVHGDVENGNTGNFGAEAV